jgi:plasmid stabilization system protein ParE
MASGIVLTPEARRQARSVDAWWREHRPYAPGLFAEELSSALTTLAGAPSAGRPYPHPRVRQVRRLLLPSTRHHVYYRIEEGAVIVLAIWSAVRGAGPPLSRRP